MMDTILTISVLQYKSGLRRDLLLASARLDVGAIWTQSGHAIAEKWITLTHPYDPTGEIKGYLNCEITILPGGEIAPPIEKERYKARELLAPEGLGGGKLKARYILGIHRGEHINLSGKKHYTFVRVFFAGLSGETTKRKNSQFPIWQEEIVFTELFPPMYNRFRIDVHLGKKIVCTKYLNLLAISDATVKGFLPTYGPSFLYLYSPPYNYLGSLLISLETKTVYALFEHEKLLDVRRRRGSKLKEKVLWNYEEFAVFGIIFELSMLKKDIGTDKELSIALGFGMSDKNPLSDDNVWESWKDKTVKMDETYLCVPTTMAKQTLFTKDKLVDNRQRLFISNRLNHIATEFGQELIKLQFLLEHLPDVAAKRLTTAMKNLIEKLKNFKTIVLTGPTILDKERLKTINSKVDSIIIIIEQNLSSDFPIFTKYDNGLKVFEEILSIVNDPQESFPRIILTIRNNDGIIAYTKVRPRDVLYSMKNNERGIQCGLIQSLFLTNTKKNEVSGFGGKIDILLWFGPLASIGYGLSSIPSGFQDISQDRVFPRALVYAEPNLCAWLPFSWYLFRVLYEIINLFRSYPDDETMSMEILIKKALSPNWMETLVIKDINLYGSFEDIRKNHHKIVIEFWNNKKSENNLIGRFFVKPHVFLKDDKLQPPNYPPQLEWQRICDHGRVKGEILAMFEIVQNRDTISDEEEAKNIIELPKYIKPPTKMYRFEILFWGIRATKAIKVSTLNNPWVIMDCGSIHLESPFLKDIGYYPNFSGLPVLAEIEMPMNWYFTPPFVVRLFDSHAFGTRGYIGSEIIRNLKQYYVSFPTKKDWNYGRSHMITMRATSIFTDLEKLEAQRQILSGEEGYMNEPLVNLKKYDKEAEQYEPAKPCKCCQNIFYSCWKRFLCGKMKEKYSSYMPLKIIGSRVDPDMDEQSYDWWTKYYDSTSERFTKNIKESINDESKILRGLKKRTDGIMFYTEELEKQPEFEAFQDLLHSFIMNKTSSTETKKTFLIKAGVALYDWPANDAITPDGYDLEQGIFSPLSKELTAVISVVIRVYIIKGHRLHSKDRFGKVDPYIIVAIPSKTISDSKNFIRQDSNPIFGKFFELEGKLPYDSILNVSIMDKAINELVGETEIDLENRYYSRHRGTCGIQKSYSKDGYNAWRDVYKPSEILSWLCISNNIPEPDYASGFIIVAKRKFGIKIKKKQDEKEELALLALHNWHKIPFVGKKLLKEHVETRSLYNPQFQNMEQGKLEMWVDILPYRPDMPIPVNVTPRIPQKYELRAIVWETQNVKLVEEGIMVSKRHTDIFVKGWMIGKLDIQKTDTHFTSLTGEGLFNWRFIFNFAYDREEEMVVLESKSKKIPPVIYFQVWDYDRLFSDDYIGALSIDLRNLQSFSKRIPYTKGKFTSLTGRKLNLFNIRNVRGWWPFIGPSKSKIEKVGMLDLELQLLTTEEAERNPAGHGRNEPNKLPEPLRPIVKYTVWIAPFRAIKNYLWRYHKRKMIQCLLFMLVITFCLIGFYSIPTFTVKKIIGA